MLLIFAGLLWAAPAAASTYVVNSNSDFSDPSPGDNFCGVFASGACSLRAAIEESNADAGPDTIQVPAGTYEMGGLEPEVDSEVTILGGGSATTTLTRSAVDPGRVLSVGSAGVLDLRDVTLTGGILAAEGAGIRSSGDLTLRRTVVTANKAVGSDGGGIWTADFSGPTLIEDSSISDNEAGGAGIDAAGGGIRHGFGAGSLTIESSTVSGNRVDGERAEGGGIAVGSPLELTDSTIASNTAKSDAPTYNAAVGSAIYGYADPGEVTITRATIRDNLADQANAGFADSTMFLPGEVTVVDSTIADNSGGYRVLVGAGTGLLTIRGSTFSENDGGVHSGSVMSITNSSFTATQGTALTAGFDGSLTIRSSTISDSTASGVQVGFPATTASAVITGSILAGNALNCSISGSSTISSGGGNVEDDDDCGFAAANDLVNTDPLLAPLANNGGLTKTRALPANSPAVDNFVAGCPPPAADQRGKARPQGSACDSGAYEFDTPAAVTINSGPSGTTADPTPFFTFSANEPVSGAECRLLGAGTTFVACSSPASYGPLANGDYTFEVRVIDSDGNPSPTASRSFTVAVPAPTPGPGTGPKADTKVLDPDVSLDKKLFVKNKELKVKVSAGAQEDVTVEGKATVVVKPKKKKGGGKGGKGRRAKTKITDLKPVTKQVEGGERTILRLKYRGGKKKRQRLTKRLVRQINRGKKVRARVQVTLTDDAGNSVTEKRVARLKVKKRKR